MPFKTRSNTRLRASTLTPSAGMRDLVAQAIKDDIVIGSVDGATAASGLETFW